MDAILEKQTNNWQNAKPFPHIIVDNFLDLIKKRSNIEMAKNVT